MTKLTTMQTKDENYYWLQRNSSLQLLSVGLCFMHKFVVVREITIPHKQMTEMTTTKIHPARFLPKLQRPPDPSQTSSPSYTARIPRCHFPPQLPPEPMQDRVNIFRYMWNSLLAIPGHLHALNYDLLHVLPVSPPIPPIFTAFTE